MITYDVATFTDTDTTAEVTYTNNEGHVHIRRLNIARTEDGTLDSIKWQEILDGQERNVQNKVSLGVISFQDPAEQLPSAEP